MENQRNSKKSWLSLILITVTIIEIVIASPAIATTWQAMNSFTTQDLRWIWGTSPDNIYIVGNNGTILHYDGIGQWVQMNSPTSKPLVSIWGSSDSDVWIVGGNGAILRQQNGNAWQEIPGIPENLHFYQVQGTCPNDVYAVGQYDSGHGCIFHWDGTSWTNEQGLITGPLGTSMQFNTVWAKGPHEIYVAGHNGYSSGLEGVCYKYDGQSWNWIWSGNDPSWPKMRTVYSIWGSNGHMFMGGVKFASSYAEVYHHNWFVWASEIFQDSQAITNIWGNSEDDVYMVGYEGKIVHYDGATWYSMDSGVTNLLLAIWGDGTGNTYAVGANGTILFLSAPVEPPIEVDIDIKPGSYPNAINLGSHGLIPVAIFSEEWFDATTIDPETIELAGAGIPVRGKSNKYMAHKEDVDGDGLLDLVVQVATENLDPNSFQDGYAMLSGSTYDGEDIEGKDEIRIVPSKE